MPPNPVELLKSQRMGEILSQLRDTFNVFLCDSPPVLPVADALVLASKLDVPLLCLVCSRVATAKYDSYYHYRTDAKKTTV